MALYTQPLAYWFTGINGTKARIYMGLWRMKTEIEANRVRHLIALDSLPFMNMAQRKEIWLRPWMHNEQPHLVLLWTEAVDRELVEVVHVMIQDNYHGTPCSLEDTETILLAGDVVSAFEEQIRTTREKAARN